MASRQATDNATQILTHEGACGTCSSFADLAVYLEKPNLAQLGIECAVEAIFNLTKGIECYMGAGYTESCAATWVYNSFKTREACAMCPTHVLNQLPNNGPPPECELAECLQCDEDEAGPIFKQYAGRTRRGSGLVSAILRPCDSIPSITHYDPCDPSIPVTFITGTGSTPAPVTPAPSSMPSMEDDGSAGPSVFSASSMLLFGAIALLWLY